MYTTQYTPIEPSHDLRRLHTHSLSFDARYLLHQITQAHPHILGIHIHGPRLASAGPGACVGGVSSCFVQATVQRGGTLSRQQRLELHAWGTRADVIRYSMVFAGQRCSEAGYADLEANEVRI